MTERATLIASLTREADVDRLEGLVDGADLLELRADLIGEVAAERLRQSFDGRLVYTSRSAAEGGAADLEPAERRRRLTAAARRFDLVDLEAERDLEPELLDAVPAEKRIVSWHGRLAEAPELGTRLDRMSRVGAALYKLVPRVDSTAQALWPLELLVETGRRDVVAFASGEAGSWSRLLAPRLGAPWIYASAGAVPAAEGQMSIATLERDYGLPELLPVRRLFGVVGRPVAHSLSPRLHNGLYRRLGIEALYLPFHVEEFGRFWLDLVEGADLGRFGMPLSGLRVTAPYKAIALAVAGASSPLAARIMAANTLVLRRGVWEAESTDPEGVVRPLAAKGVRLDGIDAAVVGVGGAGAAAAVGLEQAGARVCLANRTAERARQTGARLGMAAMALDELDPGRFDLVVNATPLGRTPGDPLPFEVGRMTSGAAVVDMVYVGGGETPLVEAARSSGLVVVDGREVLLHQAFPQFESMTGRQVPVSEARALLGLEPTA
ncbi:MAG: type I 3-dehydroquinate dehydratase [Thermoanaerobaculia bacterium]|nr:type I 3-dehydroquinate dehydratase [Thermoanaerobaculia bacterium]